MKNRLVPAACLPVDHALATLVGRVWSEREGGPVLVAVRGDDVVDLSRVAPTASELFELRRSGGRDPRRRQPASRRRARRRARGRPPSTTREPPDAWLLAPCDLQAIKAAGVTFVASMLERVIEEQARGDAGAGAGRARVDRRGDRRRPRRTIKPGSPEAARLKEVLIARGRVVAVPRGRHRPRRRDLHQGAADVGGGHRRRGRHPPRVGRGTTPSPRWCWR